LHILRKFWYGLRVLSGVRRQTVCKEIKGEGRAQGRLIDVVTAVR